MLTHTILKFHMRSLFAKILRPVFLAFIFISMKVLGFRRKDWGQCSFWGNEAFLALCAESLGELKRLDSDLYDKMTRGQRLYFYSSTKKSEQASQAGIFSINDGFCSWGMKGVIARLVYAFYLAEERRGRCFSPREHMLLQEMHSRVKARTRGWLDHHGFPQKFGEIFR